MAPAHTKRLLNQAIFKRFLIFNGDEMKIDPELSEPFEQFLSPIKEDLAVANRIKDANPDSLSNTIKSAKRHIHEHFGCGASRHAIQTYSDGPNFFEPNSSSKDFLGLDYEIDITVSVIMQNRDHKLGQTSQHRTLS